MTNEEIDAALKLIDEEIEVPRFNWTRDSDDTVRFIDSTEFRFERDTGLQMVQWFEEILNLDSSEMADMMDLEMYGYQGKGEVLVAVIVDNDMAVLFIKRMLKLPDRT